jgi:hypothetical protein
MARRTIVETGLASARAGTGAVMEGGIGTIIYVVIGAFVAAANNYFSHVGTLEGVASAIIAILLWPLILIGIDIRIT